MIIRKLPFIPAVCGLFLVSVFSSCQPSGDQVDNRYPTGSIPYTLNHPDTKFFLNDDLMEISGLSYYGPHQLACVQDEEGKVFIYDTQEKKIVERIRFGRNGDFEGVEVVDSVFYAVRSDGMLFRFMDNGTREVEAQTISLPLSKENDVEGLGYDPTHHQLLILCKENGGLNGTHSAGRNVFAYNLTEEKFIESPYATIHPKSLQSFVSEEKDGKKKFAFKPSGLAVHPLTRQLFVLSSSQRLLVVLNERGGIVECVRLNPKVFKQPEGICFSPNGDLFIASEGNEDTGYILQFRHQP